MADKGFWKTLPGIITAITGLIAAVGSILVTMHSLGWLGTAQPPYSVSPAEVSPVPALGEITAQQWHSRAVDLWNGTVFEPADLAVQ